MHVKAVDHITINVRDIEESNKFYGEILGLPYLGTVDMGDHELTYYQLTEATKLELIRYRFDSPDAVKTCFDKGMLRHFCIETDDLQKAFEDIKFSGVKILTEPAYIEKLSFENFLFEDPNGVEIEVIVRK